MNSHTKRWFDNATPISSVNIKYKIYMALELSYKLNRGSTSIRALKRKVASYLHVY